MMRAVAFALIFVFALAALWASEHSTPNAGLPVVKAAAVRNADRKMPAWRLKTLCPVDQRNVPMLPDERSA
jgi:hypothetical protein